MLDDPAALIASAQRPKVDLDAYAAELAGLNPVQMKLQRPGDFIKGDIPEPLIEGILTKGSLAVLYGPPGSGKSFIALDWAMSVGANLHWQGREVRGGPVLYVVAEGVAGMRKRVRAWLQHFGVDSDIHLHPGPVNLLDDEAVTQLAETAKDLHAELLIVDTLHRSMVGGDENSSVDMGKAIDSMVKLQAAGPTVLAVHHTNKLGDVRGHSSLLGAVDHMVVTHMAEDHTIWVRSKKSKDDEPFRPMPLYLRGVALPFGSSCVVTGARWDG
jgi:RecA-family ATPase